MTWFIVNKKVDRFGISYVAIAIAVAVIAWISINKFI